MQKRVSKKQPGHLKDSDGRPTPGIRGGHPVAKQGTMKGVGIRRNTVRRKDGTKRKTHNMKRTKMGGMAGTGMQPSFKPFMM